jgi:hypothetical protein
MSKYRTIPVDFVTFEKLIILTEAKRMGKRAQGALAGALIADEYQKWADQKLLPRYVDESAIIEQLKKNTRKK